MQAKEQDYKTFLNLINEKIGIINQNVSIYLLLTILISIQIYKQGFFCL